MAKKKKTTNTRPSAQKVWLAGLGALAIAEEEGGKLFRSLVSKGEKYEKGLNKPVERATKKVKGTVKEVRGRAGKTLAGIEAALDRQVTAALHRVGVPTRKEIADLARKVDRLNKTIGARKPAKKKAARRTAKKA